MPVFVRQIQVGRHVRSGVRDVVVGSRASPFASAEQACRMYSRGLRQLACWTKSEYQRIAFMLSTCRTAPKGESRLAPVLRLPSVQASPGGQVGRVRLERGEVSGVGLGEEVPVDPLIALLLCLQQHPPSDLATGAPRARLYLPLAFFHGAPDTSTSSTVPGIVQSADACSTHPPTAVPYLPSSSQWRRPSPAAVGSVGLVVGLFWDGDPVLQPALRRY
eukprot:tig00021687_g23127.t1